MTKRNMAVESQIRLFTDEFQLIDIPLADINRTMSARNQNRGRTALNEENVLRLACAIESGVAHPPIIVNRVGTAYAVIDGNHRVEANRTLDRASIPAYVVQVDSDTYGQMCLSGNAWNGLPLSDGERVANAMKQIKLGLPATTVGKVWGIKPDRLQKLARCESGRDKLDAARIRGRVSDTVAEMVNRFEVDHLRSLGTEVLKASATDLAEVARAIDAAPSAERATVAIKQAGVLESRRVAKEAPKSKMPGAMSQRQARELARKLLVGVRGNRALLNDRDLLGYIGQLGEVARGSAEQAA